MSSIHDAILNATQTVLGETLAPELVDRMAAQIMAHAQPDLEAALAACAGFPLGQAGRGRSVAAPAARGRKRRDAATEASSPVHAESDEGSPMSPSALS